MELLFVYNAKSDALNAAVDYVHKIFSPATYNCRLCALTHGNFGEKKEWAEFVKRTSIDFTFYHIDEFEKKFSHSFDYPVVLKKDGAEFIVALANNEIDDLTSLQALIDLLEKYLTVAGQGVK